MVEFRPFQPADLGAIELWHGQKYMDVVPDWRATGGGLTGWTAEADGVLLGEADTVDGLFSISVGVSAAEVYLVPLDLDSGATDWAPPCANRVVPVLAA